MQSGKNGQPTSLCVWGNDVEIVSTRVPYRKILSRARCSRRPPSLSSLRIFCLEVSFSQILAWIPFPFTDITPNGFYQNAYVLTHNCTITTSTYFLLPDLNSFLHSTYIFFHVMKCCFSSISPPGRRCKLQKNQNALLTTVDNIALNNTCT